MATYSTPGVYIQEISTFPPSVAEVSTAIPAFIGYTERGSGSSTDPKILRINTLLEYQVAFGAARPSNFTVKTNFNESTQTWEINELERAKDSKFTMYDCLSLYFKNGGGSCYILSIGSYQDTPDKAGFGAGLSALEKEDEPTLILFPDALSLSSQDYYDVCVQSLAQCNKLGDRFSIFDVPEQDASAFRNGVASDYLMYGAAYYPYLNTSLTYHYQEDGVSISKLDGESVDNSVWREDFGQANKEITVSFAGETESVPKVKIVSGNATDEVSFVISDGPILTIGGVNDKTGQIVAAAWDAWVLESADNAAGYSVEANGEGDGNVPHTSNSNVELKEVNDADSMATIRNKETALYHQIKALLNEQRISLPPSAAIAGVYARVDRERGVWKAPANVNLASVIGPSKKITDEEQGRLNIDSTAGKSINAIRAFTGKGTMVWGARTLAGNDNEWRYVSVRRLFNMIEESTKKATAFAVFEANDATTWLKVKAMIESYLFGLWERGALAGSTPEAAYYVNVGLGKTMTTQDVLEGRMNVEIGIAAVRPAEFIILKFMHKLQEA